MERTIECPACGGPIEARNPGILMSVCPFCDNAVYWNEEGIQFAFAEVA